MSRVSVVYRVISVVLSFLFCQIPIAQAALRQALVIGNSSYEVGKLRNPINDATDIAKVLRQLDFQVEVLLDVGQREMDDAIHEFGLRLRKGGLGLFYFAGHGIQLRGQNYLIPTDAHLRSDKDLQYEAVNLGRVLDRIHDAGNRLNIIILDKPRHRIRYVSAELS